MWRWLVVLMASAAGCAMHAPSEPMVREERRGGWSEIGRSVRGRSIEAMTVGRGSARVLLIGGIHGDEAEGQAAIGALASMLDRQEDATVRIVRDTNPDGTAAGTRGNAHGVDLNRNWPARNFRSGGERGEHPLSEPESGAMAVEIDVFGPTLVIVFHSTPDGPFVNYDGPARAHAEAFAGGAAGVDGRWRVVGDMGYPTPGSLGSHLGVDRGVPILTIEFDRGELAPRVVEAALAGMAAVIKGQR